MVELNQEQTERALSILVPWMGTHGLKAGQPQKLEGCAFAFSFHGDEIDGATATVVAVITEYEALSASLDAAIALCGERALADYRNLLAAGPPTF